MTRDPDARCQWRDAPPPRAGWGGLNGEVIRARREGDTAANGQHDVRGARLGWADKRFDVTAAATISSNDRSTAIGSDFKDLALAGRVDLGGKVGKVGNTDIGANDARQPGLGYVHTLSKRSVVYGTLSRVQNRGAATYAVPGGPSGLAAGGNSTGVEFGVRHNF